jgi:FlaA1/EpsC-like NDP-sugar epimerase
MAHSSRRTFLKTTTLAAATLAFPSGVFSQSTTTPSPLRLGIIGAGHRGNVHISSIKSFDQFQIVSVCDVREKQLGAAVERIGAGCRPYLDYHELLAADLDAVLIATPNCTHKEIALAASRPTSTSSAKSPWPSPTTSARP